ncbi:hypothetical protein ACG98H_09475 [Corynebacterium sp. L4756]|uniref:hypothetical protein n=1 Tax=unclassified Corynebacterium TaxID=2624378 RepID=UPI00374DC1B8
MTNKDNIDNHPAANAASTMGELEAQETPQPFAFLQPFGEEGVGVCDVEGNCS